MNIIVYHFILFLLIIFYYQNYIEISLNNLFHHNLFLSSLIFLNFHKRPQFQHFLKLSQFLIFLDNFPNLNTIQNLDNYSILKLIYIYSTFQ